LLDDYDVEGGMIILFFVIKSGQYGQVPLSIALIPSVNF
jgi:hypothetical protein